MNRYTLPDKETGRVMAFHEAGLAAAIHFGNQEKQLPPVFFQISIFQPLNTSLGTEGSAKMAKLQGGRLIHTLPESLALATKTFTDEQKIAYQSAFNADIFNILAGSVAQACYVSLRDNELINPHLMDLDTLQLYGDGSDFAKIDEYLNCVFSRKEFIERKMRDFFHRVFGFVRNQANWYAISALAEYILLAEKSIIAHDEIVAVLETGRRLTAIPEPANSTW